LTDNNTLAEHKQAEVTDHPRNAWPGSFRHRRGETRTHPCLNRCWCHGGVIVQSCAKRPVWKHPMKLAWKLN